MTCKAYWTTSFLCLTVLLCILSIDSVISSYHNRFNVVYSGNFYYFSDYGIDSIHLNTELNVIPSDCKYIFTNAQENCSDYDFYFYTYKQVSFVQ